MSAARSNPPRWEEAQLVDDLNRAVAFFREERVGEPLEEYLERFEEAQDTFEELLEATVDLTELSDRAIDTLKNPKWLDALRYIAGPPISVDDLKTLSESTLNLKKLGADAAMAKRVVDTVLLGLDRKRFPWLALGEVRQAEEHERRAAVLATAAIVATRQVETLRRHTGKKAQEERVMESLRNAGFNQVKPRRIPTMEDAPALGEFCGESMLGTRKADIVVRLWDRRIMPIECKVSNSALNSIKRLNNDASVKAGVWLHDMGASNVVPAAVLSGVYGLRSLTDAQSRGLTLYWAHNLQALVDWIETTRP